ncbi:MAG: Hsp20/alpha crystallin family protein [Nitrospirae bacterium]|nr:MAG: Hsp20/alpha crystallin family protein [Nitrospirota bacterium]
MSESTTNIQKKEAAIPEKGERTRERRVYSPQVDIIERKSEIVVVADMPGVDEKSVDITLEKNVLTIYGTVEAEMPENQRLSVLEYGIGDYQRSFALSDEVDKEKIQASVKNGVLKLVMPKKEEVKAKKIQVTAQ